MKKLIAIALALVMVLSMTACAKEEPQPTVAETAAPTEAAPVETTAAPVETEAAAPINVMVLNGTTGFGMANLMDAAAKGEAAQAYTFTVENTNAVREGADLPDLLIDTGGDSLFYSYWDDDLYKTGYHSLKQDGEWSRVSLHYIDTSYLNYDVDICVGVNGQSLFYDVQSYDKLENLTDHLNPEYMDIPVSPAFAEKLKLATFDIDMLSPEPGFIRPYPGLCAPLLEEGDTLTALNIQKDNLIMMVRKACRC